MPKSMTGFGRGECLRYDRLFKVEIKSVNHRYNDITIKLPRFLNTFEDKIRKRLSKDITRGKVDCWINFESFATKDITVNINEAYADAYMEALRTLSARYKYGDNIPLKPGLELMAKNPDVFTYNKIDAVLNDGDIQAEIWETLSEAVEAALSQYNTMRETEGAALCADIHSKRQRIQALLSQLAVRVPAALAEQAAKLRERINDMLENIIKPAGHQIDEARFVTEVAILADRSTVDEEITRLNSHLIQLDTILKEKVSIGRKLDFLVQELNREVNTIGSKSTDVELARLVVELKSEVEKIREQVQNLE